MKHKIKWEKNRFNDVQKDYPNPSLNVRKKVKIVKMMKQKMKQHNLQTCKESKFEVE